MLLFLSDGYCEKATHAATDARYIWRDRALRSWSPLRVPWCERYTCNKSERQIFYRENWQSHFIHLFGAWDSCERGSQRIFKSSLSTRKKCFRNKMNGLFFYLAVFCWKCLLLKNIPSKLFLVCPPDTVTLLNIDGGL